MAFLLSSSLLRFTAGISSRLSRRVAAGANARKGSVDVLFGGRFLQPSDTVHCLWRRFSSVSARASSSRNSRTRRSWAAIATIEASDSTGELKLEVSIGVGGTDDVGVGREEMLVGSAMGSVKESRFAFRDADDAERMERVSDVSFVGGGGGIVVDVATSTFVDTFCPAWSPSPSREEGVGVIVADALASDPRSMLETFRTASRDTGAMGEARDKRRSKPMVVQPIGPPSRAPSLQIER